MESFARLLSLQIEAEESQQQTAAALVQERHTGELREQFIAVLGHDLRNPLFAINISAERQLRKHSHPDSNPLVRCILASGQRAAQLVEDVLGYPRARLGPGITLDLAPCADLEHALHQVIAEVQNVHPGRTIESRISNLQGIRCDRQRIAQMLSNLVANAISHGAADGVVEVEAVRQLEVVSKPQQGTVFCSSLELKP